MDSRLKILQAVKQNQPEEVALPTLSHFFDTPNIDLLSEFTNVVEGIGAKVFVVHQVADVINQIRTDFVVGDIRIVSPLVEYKEIAENFNGSDNHQLADVELIILPTKFAVAENGSCWLSDDLFMERVLPFIPQHLILIAKKENIVATMHHAYQLIADQSYGFGTFIAGPSKTADIEQSLVLGAHGPRSLRVFFVN